MKQINILAFGAHPDDVEACSSGFLLKAKQKGLTTGIVDMTAGEASIFGTVEERNQEAKKAAKILGLDLRLNLNILDAHVIDSEEIIEKVVKVIRELKPEIILAPYYNDLHPDHANTGLVVKKAAFFSKIQKFREKINLPAHQLYMVLYYMLHTEFHPSFVLDITDVYKTKLKSIYAHKSQFFVKENNRYTNKFHNPEFMEFFDSRSKVYGYKVGVRYGEPYLIDGLLGLKDFRDILSGNLRSLTSWKKKEKM